MTTIMKQPTEKLPAPAVLKKFYDEIAASAYEIWISALPYFMGAVLLAEFAQRKWMWFYPNLVLAAALAAASVLLHRMRRKRLALQEELLEFLRGEHKKASEFLQYLGAAAGPTGKGEVTIEVELHEKLDRERGVSLFGETSVKAETRPEKMN